MMRCPQLNEVRGKKFKQIRNFHQVLPDFFKGKCTSGIEIIICLSRGSARQGNGCREVQGEHFEGYSRKVNEVEDVIEEAGLLCSAFVFLFTEGPERGRKRDRKKQKVKAQPQ